MDERRRFTSLSDLRTLVPDVENGAAPAGASAGAPAGAPAKVPAKVPAKADPLLARLKLHVQLETKGRRGKGVTVVYGFHHTDKDLRSFARALKALCGAGGTVKDERIEVQGDHREKIAAHFRVRGWTVILHH